MKVLIPCDTNPNGISGGLTFIRNFKRGLEELGHTISDIGGHICLIPGATMVKRETFYNIKKQMPVVLRIDGIPEDWRNRGSGTTRLKEYAKEADALVYQSEFSLDYVGSLLGRKGAVIYNGVDYSIFSPSGEEADLPKGNPRILHIMYRQDPNKRPEEVITFYRSVQMLNKEARLILVGRYPKDWANYKFGFFAGEHYTHIESAREHELAKIMRACDVMWYPSFADPCPNIVLEALACGLPVTRTNKIGGTRELIKRGAPDSVKAMAEQYVSLFDLILRKDVKIEA